MHMVIFLPGNAFSKKITICINQSKLAIAIIQLDTTDHMSVEKPDLLKEVG